MVQREALYRYLYLDWAKKAGIMAYLRGKGLKNTQCLDIYKDALIAFERSVVRQKYDIEKATVDGYVFGICRFLWIRHLKAEKTKADIQIPETEVDVGFIANLFDRELAETLDKIINLLTPRCTKVIRLWSHGCTMKEIAEQMNYQSEVVARKSKYQCINSLYKLLDKKPHLKNQLRNWL